MHFLDVDVDVTAAGAFLYLLFELVNLGAFTPDDDPRPRRLDDDAQLVARALDLDGADACRLKLVLQLVFQLDVGEQLFVIVTLGKPARLPRLRVSKPKTIRMDFLSHRCSYQS